MEQVLLKVVGWTAQSIRGHCTALVQQYTEHIERRKKTPSDNNLMRNLRAKFSCYSVEGKVLGIEAKGLMKPTVGKRVEIIFHLRGLA